MGMKPTTKYPKINGTDFCYLIGQPIQQYQRMDGSAIIPIFILIAR